MKYMVVINQCIEIYIMFKCVHCLVNLRELGIGGIGYRGKTHIFSLLIQNN